MQPFMAPVVQALDLLDGVPAPAQSRGCSRIPFAVYAAAGWPMLAGKIDHPTIETLEIAFDYRPQGDELAMPALWSSPSKIWSALSYQTSASSKEPRKSAMMVSVPSRCIKRSTRGCWCLR